MPPRGPAQSTTPPAAAAAPAASAQPPAAARDADTRPPTGRVPRQALRPPARSRRPRLRPRTEGNGGDFNFPNLDAGDYTFSAWVDTLIMLARWRRGRVGSAMRKSSPMAP